ncbi:MAG: FIG022979: MoxR-like ATPases, partial [uncultured Thermomicrobiales bacterium]
GFTRHSCARADDHGQRRTRGHRQAPGGRVGHRRASLSRACADRRRSRCRQNGPDQGGGAQHRQQFQAYPVHSGSAPERCHRRQHLQSTERHVRVSTGADRVPNGAGGRDQPGHSQDPGGVAGSDGRGTSLDRRGDASVAASVHRSRHGKSDRLRGNLSAPRGPARQIPAPALHRLPGAAWRTGDARSSAYPSSPRYAGTGDFRPGPDCGAGCHQVGSRRAGDPGVHRLTGRGHAKSRRRISRCQPAWFPGTLQLGPRLGRNSGPGVRDPGRCQIARRAHPGAPDHRQPRGQDAGGGQPSNGAGPARDDPRTRRRPVVQRERTTFPARVRPGL